MNHRPDEEAQIRNQTTLVRVIDSASTVHSLQWIIMDTLLALIDNSLLDDCFAFWFPFRYATVLVVNADVAGLISIGVAVVPAAPLPLYALLQ